jgi:pimeloyl-ACP methyl ester carboxylesterase
MRTARSEDGTRIAFEQSGAGPPIVLVAGALSDRSLRPLAAALGARFFTAVAYDRRGRGASGDAAHYEVEREIEDLAAVMCNVGGVASLFGHAAGAVLALHAAASGLPIAALALYEPPFRDQGASSTATMRLQPESVTARPSVHAMALGTAGSSDPGLADTQSTPTAMGSLARPLAYDAAIMGDGSIPLAVLSAVKTPTVVIDGDQSCTEKRVVARKVAHALPDGRHCTLVGASHDVDAKVTAPLLEEFFLGFTHGNLERNGCR